jgi:GT2 family glycosyltransferase
MNQANILIIGVIYNTYPETLRYLDSLAPLATEDITLIIVDNSDKVKPPDFLRKTSGYEFVHYIDSEVNTGYFHGAKKGLEAYLQEHSVYPEWILVTNVDIVFTPRFFIQLKTIKEINRLGMIAPSILSQKWKLDYNPGLEKRYSKQKLQFHRIIYSHYYFHNLYLILAYTKRWLAGAFRKRRTEVAEQTQGQKRIYAPHGSCLVFNKNYFTFGGTLDLPNFLFGEEIFVAESSKQMGLDIIYDPRLVIYDYEHASVGFFVTPTTNAYYRQANQMVLDRYYS